MKRLSAILFLLVLVFNFYGYRMIISYMEKGSDASMEQKLDRSEYSDDELVSIKTKLNLPYYTSSPSFERTYGSVTIDGIVYEYVQRRVYNDTLELLCLPNNTKTKLHDIKNELTKSSVDGQTSTPLKKGTSTLKISFPDFCQSFETVPTGVSVAGTDHFLQNESFLISNFKQQQERPPQAI